MDLDFLTEEVKKLARQTGEFLKRNGFLSTVAVWSRKRRMTMCRTWTKHLKTYRGEIA